MNIDSEQLVYSLKQTFYQKFDVPYKTIIENDLYKYDSFSKYQTNIQYFDVFEVELDNGYKKFFKNKLYEIIIPRNIRLSEAPSHGKPIMLYDSKCVGARAYKALVEEFLSKQ